LDGINWNTKRALEVVFSLGETVDLSIAKSKGFHIFLYIGIFVAVQEGAG